jgi:C3HC zinc finger-like
MNQALDSTTNIISESQEMPSGDVANPTTTVVGAETVAASAHHDHNINNTSHIHPADAAASNIRQILNNMVSSPPASSPLRITHDDDDTLVPVVDSRRETPRSILHFPKEYRQRLQSFTTVGYFAKPIQLSPIICAISGWELRPSSSKKTTIVGSFYQLSTSMDANDASIVDAAARLVCPSCDAVLVVLVPQLLSTTAKLDLIRHYQQQLWQAHKIPCRHRKETEYLINVAFKPQKGNHRNRQSPVVPTLLARALQSQSTMSASSLELVEQACPWLMFRQKWLQVYPHVSEIKQSVQLPDKLLYFRNESSESTKTILNRILDTLQNMEVDDGEDTTKFQFLRNLKTPIEIQAAETAAALVLTGWEICQCNDAVCSDTTSSVGAIPPIVSIECIFCLSKHPLTQPSTDTDVSSPQQPTKRQRTIPSLWNEPFAAHRYYCPWVCGFPLTCDDDNKNLTTPTPVPLWQILADRLMTPPMVRGDTQNHDTQSVITIHQQLRAGVSSLRYTNLVVRK